MRMILICVCLVAIHPGNLKPAALLQFSNTCYSLVGPEWGISVAGVYYFDGEKLAEREGSGGVSPIDADAAFRQAEAVYGAGWYASISADTWGSA